MLTQFPGEVGTVGPDPVAQGEDHIEQPRHRLRGVEPALEPAARPVGLERAVCEVEVAIDARRHNGLPLVTSERGLSLHGRGNPASRDVSKHWRPRLGPSVGPAIAAERRRPFELVQRHRNLVQLGGSHHLALLGALREYHVHVDV